MGCAARSRLLAVAGLFRAAFLRTRRAPFSAPGLSSDLCRVRDGARVDVLVAGSTDDERLAPHACHERGPRGLARPWLAGAGELGDVVYRHGRAVLAQLAPPFAEPADQLPVGCGCGDRGGVADDRAPVALEGYPAESRNQVRLALPPSPGLKAGPGASSVMTFALWRAAILVTVDLCLALRVLSHPGVDSGRNCGGVGVRDLSGPSRRRPELGLYTHRRAVQLHHRLPLLL